MRRVRNGDKFVPSARDWNNFLDAVDFVRAAANRFTKPILEPLENGIAFVKNTTGTKLDQFSVVGLDDTIVTDPKTDQDPTNELEFKQQKHIFNAVVPSIPKHEGKWGITLDVIAPNAIGRVRVAGIVIVKGEWEASELPDRGGRKFAEAIDGDVTKLKVGSRGSAQILWMDDATSTDSSGSGWCIIRIGNVGGSEGGSRRFRAVLGEDMTPADEFAYIVDFTEIEGELPDEPVDVANVMKWYGKEGNVVKVEWNPNFNNGEGEPMGGWEFYAIEVNYTEECFGR